jgi:hypothetical protein
MARGTRFAAGHLETHMAERYTTKSLKVLPVIPQAKPQEGSSAVRSGIDAEVQAHIGRQLRAVYDDVANEPVPDRFLRLLRELDKKRDAARDDII